jgi:serine/threonine protein kinase
MILLFKIVESTEVYVKSRVGTLVYMAPEQFPKSLTLADVRNLQYKKTADIYSLALVLHQLFGAGADFFPRYRDNLVLSFAKSKGEAPQLNLAQLPPRLRSVVRKGVATDPKARPTLDEFFGAVALAGVDDRDDMRPSETRTASSQGSPAPQADAVQDQVQNASDTSDDDVRAPSCFTALYS